MFDSDKAAAQTANLRLSVEWEPAPARGAGGVPQDAAAAEEFNREKAPQGVKLWDREVRNRTTFAVFGFNGPSNLHTMAEWMKETATVSLAACLETGCVFRRPPSGAIREPWENRSIVYPSDEALMAFATLIDAAIDKHRESSSKFVCQIRRYTQLNGVPLEDSSSSG
ncbi:hypothetical protein [Sorangium sp. So ce854]|uniref:hypothetical protein n=1 Tax=Sorangium sp. So ce854 TaxID=3133322 RepID=UPI003F62C4F9